MGSTQMPGMGAGNMDMSSTGGSNMADMSNMDHGNMAGMGNMGNGSDQMMMGMTMGSMKMYFHFGTDETILFKGWQTENAGELFGSMLAVAMMAFLFEALRVLRLKFLSTTVRKITVPLRQSIASSNKLVGNGTAGGENKSGSSKNSDRASNLAAENSQFARMSFADRLVLACLKMLQFGLGYALMLVVMIYNVWLCFAVIIGFGVGFAAFYKSTKLYTNKAKGTLPRSSALQQASCVELKEAAPPSSDDILY